MQAHYLLRRGEVPSPMMGWETQPLREDMHTLFGVRDDPEYDFFSLKL